MKRLAMFLLLGAVCLLPAFGIVMLASTSYFSDELGGEGYRALRQQGIWLALSISVCVTGAMIDYNQWHRWRWWIFGLTIAGLALCYVPFLADTVKGARRWLSLRNLGLSFVHVQPSEFAKVACAIVMAGWFTRFEPRTKEFVGGFAIPCGLLLAMVSLIAGEIDLGSAALVALLGGAIMFVAGVRLRYLVPVVLSGMGALVAVVKFIPNRVERITAFQHLEEYRQSFGLQQWRSLLAFGSGGPDGVGLGNGFQKFFIPESHTDFVFPTIGEELGLRGSALVVLLFVCLTFGGMLISMCAPNRFGRLLGFGITLMLAMEALLNMGVTSALLPNKGLALPFVSYGGSSLMAAMLGVGILINIDRQSEGSPNLDLLRLPRRRMRAQS